MPLKNVILHLLIGVSQQQPTKSLAWWDPNDRVWTRMKVIEDGRKSVEDSKEALSLVSHLLMMMIIQTYGAGKAGKEKTTDVS